MNIPEWISPSKLIEWFPRRGLFHDIASMDPCQIYLILEVSVDRRNNETLMKVIGPSGRIFLFFVHPEYWKPFPNKQDV